MARYTYVIDLAQSEEELWARCEKTFDARVARLASS